MVVRGLSRYLAADRPMTNKRRRYLLLTVLALLVALGAWQADRAIRQRGHPGLRTFLAQWVRNYPRSFAMEPPVVRITIDQDGMEALERVVERSRARGVIERADEAQVQARIDAGEGAFKARVRIKGKMTDHVKGRKWSFRVIARKDGGFLGMKRFSLQHPGTRNYLCDWLFHRLARGEGIVALRYGFCRVELNGEDLGIYAYEEHFGSDLLANNGRLDGPLLRFDPALFWQHRLNGVDGVRVNDAYGAYQAAALDAYGTSDMAADPEQRRLFEEALALVESFRRGERQASEVFDADRMGRRLALIDLVGGHHSLDWSDVKFHYDPGAQRLEPVSYESFSAFPTTELAGAHRATGAVREEDDLHTQLLKDPVVMAAYVHHLERFAQQGYLDSAFAALKGPLDTASATLYAEFPYKELDRGIYYANQRAIQRLMAGPRPVHAYSQGVERDTLTVQAVPSDALPVHVDGLRLPDGRLFAPVGPRLVPCRPRGGVGRPMALRFATGPLADSLLAGGTVLLCRFPGSAHQRTVPVQPFALRTVQALAMPAHKEASFRSFPFVHVDEAARVVRLMPGAWTIDRDLVIPEGYRVEAVSPLKLMLTNGAELVSRSPLRLTGQDEMPILITSPDSSSLGVHVIAAQGRSRLDHVHFSGLMRRAKDQVRAAGVSFHRSDVSLEHCRFSGTGANLLDVSLGELQMRSCALTGGTDQLELHFVQAQVSGTRFQDAADDAVSVEGGGLSLSTSVIDGAGGVGVKAGLKARVSIKGSDVRTRRTGLDGSEGAALTMNDGSLTAPQAVKAGRREMRYGPVQVTLEGVEAPDAAGSARCGEGSRVTINGAPVGADKAAKGT